VLSCIEGRRATVFLTRVIAGCQNPVLKSIRLEEPYKQALSILQWKVWVAKPGPGVRVKKPLTAVYWEVGYVLLACTLIAISVRVGDLLAGCIVMLMYMARELCDEVGWQQFLVLAQRKRAQGPSAAGLPSPRRFPRMCHLCPIEMAQTTNTI